KSKGSTRRCSPFSPTANRGRAQASPSRCRRANAPCNGRWKSFRHPARCRRSPAAAPAVGCPRRPWDSRRLCYSRVLCRLINMAIMSPSIHASPPTSTADVVREYGPFSGADSVHGVTYDGENVWFASGDRLNAFDPASGPGSGEILRSIDVAAHAGTAFDGRHLFQLAEDRIQKIDPRTGRVLATIPAPGHGGDSGLTWAEGTLWVGQYRDRKIHQVDPQSGEILRTIE